LNDREVKPAAEVKSGDRIAVKRSPIWRSYDVLALPANRVGAKLVQGLIRETTSFADLEALELMVRARKATMGEGRPTKRNRRDLDRFQDE
jgi:ribosome-associated heat shock protein Hsp15